MRYFSLLVFGLLLFLALPRAGAQSALGSWSDHFAYRAVHQVVWTPNKVYAAGSLGLFCYDTQHETIEKITKTNLLSDVGIATMAYDEVTKCLVVAYNNANIDLVWDEKVYNLSDILRSSVPGDKSIYNISFYKRCAYLACGFGIVVVDLDRREIKNSYFIGPEGTYLAVYDVAFAGNRLVAATAQGLRFADKDNDFLNIITSWSSDEQSLLAGQPVTDLAVIGDRLMAVASLSDTLKNSPKIKGEATLYREVDDGLFEPWITGDIRSLQVADESVVVTTYGSVALYDFQLQLRQQVNQIYGAPLEALSGCLDPDGRLWIGHNWYGLVELDPPYTGDALILRPKGPESDNAFRLVTFDNKTYLCPGGHRSTYEGLFNAANVYTYEKGEWSALESSNGLRSQLRDIVDLSVNPKNPKQLAVASWGVGMAEIEDNIIQHIYTDTNSQGALGRFQQNGFSALFVGGVAYDRRGNLWMTNSLNDKGVALKKADGSWQSFDLSPMYVSGIQNDIDRVVWDSIRDVAWCYGRPNRFFVVNQDGQTTYVDPNHGSKVETSTVNCLVQDHDGNMWVGTNKGLKYIFDARKLFDNGGRGEKSPVSCVNKTIEEDGFTEYLMAYESITCMAIDGANRKWVGTSAGGLYLLSDDGSQQLLHFTSSNSPLASNKIVTLAIEPWTGEVFIGTDKGLQSYRGSATYADYLPQDDIHAFPNPVEPGYQGPIAVKGFSRNALIHITDVSGHVVFTAHATGGQVEWNGCTLEGKPVGSGVYFVFAADEAGQARCVTKVLIIR